MVAALAFFDGVFLGLPIAALAASLRPATVFACAAIGVSALSMACCRWVNGSWDEWLSGSGERMEKRLETMRASRLLRHPVAWIQSGSDSAYALTAAVANPILVAALGQLAAGKPISERRIFLGSVAYAIPYAAMWSLVGLALGDAVRAA